LRVLKIVLLLDKNKKKENFKIHIYKTGRIYPLKIAGKQTLRIGRLIMKRRFFLTAIILASVTPLFAGGIFYNSNQSAEYFRTYERNAATDNADAVYYNMSGTTKMKEGLYVNGSNQFLFQEATVKTENNPVLGDKTYKSDNPVWLCPNLYVLYKQDNWSAFTGIETIGATAIRE
jgi:hypothetical protein